MRCFDIVPNVTFVMMTRLQTCVWVVLGLACCAPLSAQNHGLHWLPNEGQWDVPAQMRAEWAGGVTWLESDGMNVWMAGDGYAELWDHHFEGFAAHPLALLPIASRSRLTGPRWGPADIGYNDCICAG